MYITFASTNMRIAEEPVLPITPHMVEFSLKSLVRFVRSVSDLLDQEVKVKSSQ